MTVANRAHLRPPPQAASFHAAEPAAVEALAIVEYLGRVLQRVDHRSARVDIASGPPLSTSTYLGADSHGQSEIALLNDPASPDPLPPLDNWILPVCAIDAGPG